MNAINNNPLESPTDISLDYYKELKLNYNDKYVSLVEELKNKYSSELKTADLNTSDKNLAKRNMIYKMNTIENMKKKKILNIQLMNLQNSRFDKFLKIKEWQKSKRCSLSTSKTTLRSKLTDIQKNNNNKYKSVLNDVAALINNLEIMKTKVTFHRVTVKDSLLNSHKDFIVINQFDKFKNGIPVLQLKKEDFLCKANLLNKVIFRF